jgi:hypothetical protein
MAVHQKPSPNSVQEEEEWFFFFFLQVLATKFSRVSSLQCLGLGFEEDGPVMSSSLEMCKIFRTLNPWQSTDFLPYSNCSNL